MTTTRRNLLLGAAATFVVARAGLLPAMAQGADAAGFVNAFGRELVGIVNGPTPDNQKAGLLAAAVERSVDIDTIAKFCLGRYARTATPAQLAEYSRLFHRVLIRSITGHLGEYKGVTFVVGRSLPNPDGQAVQSVVTRPSQAPAAVQWIVANTSAGPKIVDVVAEGTSLRLTQRSDYASFLSRNGGDVNTLLSAMQRQVG